MKRILLIAVMVMSVVVANAQNDIKIDTTDSTIKYLLERIETLEHKVAFQEDKNSLELLTLRVEPMVKEVQSGIIGNYDVIKLDKSVRENYKAICETVSFNSLKYKYTDQEQQYLDSVANLVEIYLDMLREYLGK